MMQDMTADASWTGSMPEVYDRALGPSLFQPFAQHVAAMAAELSPRRVLEIAAGSGIGTAALVRALPDAEITATDLNPGMVTWAAAKVPEATWQVEDAQQLSLPDGSFDLVTCLFGAMFFPDKPRAFAEAARVLTTDGHLLYAIWDVVAGSPFTLAMVESLNAVLPEDPPTFIVRVPHGYTDPDQIARDLTAGGLAPTSLERVVLQGSAPDARTLAEGFCLGSPLQFELEKRGSLPELMQRLGEAMVARLGDGPLVADLTAWVVQAERVR